MTAAGSYRPKVGELVRIAECMLNQDRHIGMLGTVRSVMRGRIDVDLLGGGSCTAVSVAPATDADHASVFTRAASDVAAIRANPSRYDEIMSQLLGLVALVHGLQEAEKSNQKEGEKG